jgi:threonine dehydrogenase-like Zn-dependent dehydrogenase
MRVIQVVAPRKLALLDDAPEPAPREGEVLVRCRWISLCGSNMAPYMGMGQWGKMAYPKTPGWEGHENIGTIVESRLPGWEPGTTVLAHPAEYLGFAELIRSRPPGLVPLPADRDPMPLITAQPLATVLRAMSRLGPVINRRCAVVGQGPMGLIFTSVLRHAGARQVIGIDLLDWRLEWAKRFGATDVVDASKADVAEAVRSLTQGEMVDLSVEAVGFPEPLRTAVCLAKRYGKVCVFGVPRFDSAEFPIERFFRYELEMIASVGPECVAFFDAAVRMLVGGQLDLSAMITHRLPWADAQRAFDLYADHADGALKIVLEL